MDKRVNLDKNLDEGTFRNCYYLKEELVKFCRENNLSTSGSKAELTERIAVFLKSGKTCEGKTSNKREIGNVCMSQALNNEDKNDICAVQTLKDSAKNEICATQTAGKSKTCIESIDEDTLIEDNFVCSQKHRAFFESRIGKGFSFNVRFQKWLKANAGKTYKDAIEAYGQIVEDNKKNKQPIDSQFEYNTYIRDFFADNKGKSLSDAIACWKYKKSIQGSNRYEKADLAVLKAPSNLQ